MERIERFLAKIEVDGNGCWLWTAYRDPKDGYGRFGVGGKRTMLAHRWSYEFFVGPIPKGLETDHLCRNHACVNPDHLEPVTLRENQLRGVSFSAVNARKTHCINGHEFTPENTYVRAKGRRGCRTCGREATRRYLERRAA